MISGPRELDDAAMALSAWFESQSVQPADAVIIAEFFIARMIISNGKGPADIEAKIEVVTGSIRRLLSIVPKDAQ